MLLSFEPILSILGIPQSSSKKDVIHQDFDNQNKRQQKVTRRRMLLIVGSGSVLILGGIHPRKIFAQTPKVLLSSKDILAIQALNARHFYALDGLSNLIPGDPGTNWAATFTPDGTFSIVRANGDVVIKATGTQELLRVYKTFPDVQTTRHWINDLIIEPNTQGAKGGCYIIAMNIKNDPAAVIRTGVYKDQIIKIGRNWKFKSRTLILDPNSPAG
ncbi:nuclear transport factor 2 family protein [Gloeocapsopsis crepidinum LEGE 06123]|uniref:Nuclear transport factor 2 family protein n=1 Tax=Gloeocapsopsis crepidinum LEGE 06123 TaxID=588587 RepID=A0ABR9UX35_9CHRO|nr:nuclear transport factor 2 family protein [Gloeocapsopsis crepidinum]MBE9192871.1 nuclear transport factor 2 family protein [Gloeocapsopsis crepidinum LEGE 06123]